MGYESVFVPETLYRAYDGGSEVCDLDPGGGGGIRGLGYFSIKINT